MQSMKEYSSAIQLRSDRWSALREATGELARSPDKNALERLCTRVHKLFEKLDG